MSKADEYAAKAKAVHDEAPSFIDYPIAAKLSCADATVRIEGGGRYHVTVPAYVALRLGRWLMETFGETGDAATTKILDLERRMAEADRLVRDVMAGCDATTYEKLRAAQDLLDVDRRAGS